MIKALRDRRLLNPLMLLGLATTLVSVTFAQQDVSSVVTNNGNGFNALPAHPEIVSQPKNYNRVRAAHAVLASLAWLIFFPLGGIIIRVLETPNAVWIHGVVQGMGSLLFVVGAGCGIWLARLDGVIGQYHPIIGLSLLGSLFIQPLTELLNHVMYQKHPKVIWAAHVHLWFGRLLITVGIIQGGIGFVFSASFPDAKQESWPRLLYGITATVVWILYMAGAVLWPMVRHTFPSWVARRQAREAGELQDMTG